MNYKTDLAGKGAYEINDKTYVETHLLRWCFIGQFDVSVASYGIN